MKKKQPRIRIDHNRREIFINGESITFPSKEYGILDALVSTNKALSRADLLKMVWGMEADIDTRTVDQHIARLRRRLQGDADLVQTVNCFGYRIAR